MHVPPRVIRPQGAPTEWVAKATLPTRHGNFETHVFRGAPTESSAERGEGDHALSPEHVALVFGDVGELRGRSDVLVRVHSECMTSEVFGSLKCDCKEQLDAAMAAVARAGSGAILYLRQEGRGIGLANKIRAYALQSHGHDTVDANRLLGLPDDARSYEVARDMLAHFGVAERAPAHEQPREGDARCASSACRSSAGCPSSSPPTRTRRATSRPSASGWSTTCPISSYCAASGDAE